MVRERDPYKYDVVDQHCYSVVETRKGKKADGGSEYIVYVRNPHLNENKTGMRMPQPRGPEWNEYLKQQKRMALDAFYEAFTFLARAPIPGAKGYPRESPKIIH